MDRWLTTAANEFEADAILGLLAEAGIPGRKTSPGGGGKSFGVGPYDIYVPEGDLESARETLHSADGSAPAPVQKTQPKGTDSDGEPYEPIEIPVPKRSAFDRLLHRAENTPPKRG